MLYNYNCSDKLFIKLLEIKSKLQNSGDNATIDDIIEEAVLSYYNISLIDLSDTDTNLPSYCYIYVYLDPTAEDNKTYCGISFGNKPIYVGKASNQNTDIRHLKNTENAYFKLVIENIRLKGEEPIVLRVKENITENEAFKLEADLVRNIYDQNGDICNIVKYKTGKAELNKNSEYDLKREKMILLVKALKNSKTKREAAEKLGISERTLYRRLEMLEL